MEYTTGRNEHLENGILLCDSVLGDFHTTMIEMVSVLFLYPPQTKLGGYIGITLSVRPSVRPSMYFVSANPPKRLVGFL